MGFVFSIRGKNGIKGFVFGKEIGALVNINILDTINNSIGRALLASAEVNMNQNYAVIGCIPQFSIDLREFMMSLKVIHFQSNFLMDFYLKKN